ncbi:hypothetical protein ACNKHO_05935 [Shigella flexneri]
MRPARTLGCLQQLLEREREAIVERDEVARVNVRWMKKSNV